MEYRNFKSGDLVCHFKWHNNSEKEMKENNYLYKIIATDVKHTETGEIFMVYQAQYGDKGIYARPLDMFMSEVDRSKYPDSVQKYRLIKYNEDALNFFRGLSESERVKVLSTDYSLAEFLDKYRVSEEFYFYIRSNLEL